MIMADNKQNKNPNVPNLRFGEYSDEWSLTELQKVATISKGSGISKDQLSENGTYCILYGELYTKYNSEIISEVYSKTELDAANLVKSKENDVIIPCSGETAIDISTARCVPFNGILLGGDLNIIRLKNQNGGFFAYQLNGKRKVDIAKVAQGVSVVHLYGEHLKQVKIAYPTYSEQKKIADFLSLLDSRIATQNKIIEDLKKLKVAITNWLIKSIPDCSEIKYLEKIADIYQPQTIPTSALNDEADYFVYGANGIIGKYNKYNHELSQICITCRGNTCGNINFSVPKSWITGNAMVVNTDEYTHIVNKRYLYHYLSTINFTPLISGSGQPQIVRHPLAKLKIPIPKLEHQNKIIEVIDTFEYRIEIENKYLQSLLSQKAYLLSNLFI